MTSETPAIRASDAERDQTVELLRRHSVDGRLTLEEFAARVEAAYAATTRDELEQLSRDLPEAETATPARRTAPSRFIVAVFSGATKRGRWRLARDTIVLALFGGAHVDVREAELEDPDSTITAVAVFGGIDVKVPEGVHVDVGGIAIFGGKHYRPPRAAPPPPAAPSLRVRAYAVFGGVNVSAR